jgi:hypothetical protein
MTKKPNNMSLSVGIEIQERLKRVAKKKNVFVSQLVRDILEKNLSSTDEDVDTIILKIPNSVKVTRDELRNWLLLRVEAVVNALIP